MDTARKYPRACKWLFSIHTPLGGRAAWPLLFASCWFYRLKGCHTSERRNSGQFQKNLFTLVIGWGETWMREQTSNDKATQCYVMKVRAGLFSFLLPLTFHFCSPPILKKKSPKRHQMQTKIFLDRSQHQFLQTTILLVCPIFPPPCTPDLAGIHSKQNLSRTAKSEQRLAQ